MPASGPSPPTELGSIDRHGQVRLHVLSSNLTAQRFYTGLGFEKEPPLSPAARMLALARTLEHVHTHAFTQARTRAYTRALSRLCTACM